LNEPVGTPLLFGYAASYGPHHDPSIHFARIV